MYSFITVHRQNAILMRTYCVFSGLSPILNFGTTYTKQLGYSKLNIGYLMTCVGVLSMLTKPIVGAIVDKFRIKKHMFLVFIFLTGISAFFLMFVPSLSLEVSAELNCDTTATTLRIFSNDKKKLSACDQERLVGNDNEKLDDCKVFN